LRSCWGSSRGRITPPRPGCRARQRTFRRSWTRSERRWVVDVHLRAHARMHARTHARTHALTHARTHAHAHAHARHA
jgi:hypothetical protein